MTFCANAVSHGDNMKSDGILNRLSAVMRKSALHILFPLSFFVCQWLIWGAWQFFVMPRLPASVAITLLENVVIRSLIWAFPFVLLFLTRKRKPSRSDLFSSPFPWLVCVIFLCLTTVFLYSVRLYRGLVSTYVSFNPMFLILSLSAGVIEEFSFRGGLFRLSEEKIGFWPSAVLNGAMFTLYHYPKLLFVGDWADLLSWRAVLIFVMGIVFCFMFRKWRNLALNMTVHTVWDLLAYLFCLAG